MHSSRLLASHLWIIFEPRWDARYCGEATQRLRPQVARLIDALLLYDEVIIPTHDFLILPVFATVLGVEGFEHLVQADAIRFARLDAALGYAGNGVGLSAYDIRPSEQRPDPAPCSAEPAVAADLAFSMMADVCGRRAGQTALDSVIRRCETISVAPFAGDITKQTHLDLSESQNLQVAFGLTGLDMQRLPGVAPDQMVMAPHENDEWPCNAIDAVLRIAYANLECKLVGETNAAAVFTTSPIGHVLGAKLERLLPGQIDPNAFATLREIARVPDIAKGVLDNQVALAKMLELRQTSNASAFRKWFQENATNDPVTTGRAYADLLQAVPKIQQLPLRVLRFFITSVAGFVPVVGHAISALDSFLIDHFFRGTSPRFFIDDLRLLGRTPGRDGTDLRGPR